MAADSQNLQGVKLYQQGNYDGAMQQFQQALATHPENADAYYNMAATVHRMGIAKNDQNMLRQAETLYNQCLDLNEDHVDCHRGLGVLLAETGRSDRAFKLMQNWAASSPSSPDARVELARLYEEFGDPEQAKLQLTEALQIDHFDARAWNALGRLREQAGDYGQALADYQRSYEVNSSQPQIAERIAALNHKIYSTGAPAVTPPGGTRTVNVPQPGVNTTIR